MLLASLVIISYVPQISSLTIRGDIKAIRAEADKGGYAPTEAWKLECVQADTSNPLPCSDADKLKYPKGQMPELAATAAPVVDAGPSTSEDEELEALIRGGEAGAAPKAPTGQESDEDLEALIRGGSSDGGADSAPSTPAWWCHAR